MDRPILRSDIQVVSGAAGGRRMLVFHDPLQLCDGGIALDARLLPVVELLDGRHDLYDIQLAITRFQNGILFPISEVKSLLENLDQAYILDSLHFREALTLRKWRFSAETLRLPAHAGRSYPAGETELKEFIMAAEAEVPAPVLGPEKSLTGILVPHIDIRTARPAYAHAYLHLRERRYDTVIILGINHRMQDGLYCISDKDYGTPLGELKTDKSFVSALRLRTPRGTFSPDDFDQKVEHSIEFQTVFIRHYLGEDCAIVPILCGSLHEILEGGRDPLSDERFMGMAEGIESFLQERGGRVLLIAGVDFSHIGLKFGDASPAEAGLHLALESDRKVIACLEECRPQGILESILETGDRYKVCGFPAILLFSSLLKKSRGRLLMHDYYDEKETGSAVSYASMVFSPGS